MTKAQIIAAVRAFTSEPSTTGISDSDLVDYFIMPAACAVNRFIEYFYVDGTLTLAEDSYEVNAPSDFTNGVFLELGTTLLDRIDEEQLQQLPGNWRRTTKGMPERWYAFGGKIGFDCPLNAEAAALTATLRYIGQPTISTTPGFDLLNTQDHFIPCLRAAELFLTAYGMDLTFARAAQFAAIAEREEAKVRGYYAKRRLMRGP